MSLLSRLAGIGDVETVRKLGIAKFMAMLREVAAGNLTAADIKTEYGFDLTEINGLNGILASYNAKANPNGRAAFLSRLEDILLLGETKTAGYQTEQELQAKIDSA